MAADIYPLRVLLLTVSGWVNRQLQQVIEYLVEEHRVLKEQFGDKFPRLDDNQLERSWRGFRPSPLLAWLDAARVARPDE